MSTLKFKSSPSSSSFLRGEPDAKMYLYSLGTFNGYNKNNLYNSLNKLLSTLSVLVYKIKNDLLLYSSPNLK